jgi:hypothetical protein
MVSILEAMRLDIFSLVVMQKGIGVMELKSYEKYSFNIKVKKVELKA